MTLQNCLYDVFSAAATKWPEHSFLAVPPRHADDWAIRPETTYRQALSVVDALAAAYRHRGYGVGDTIALALESRPQHMFHYLALNSIGACIAPINTDLTAGEIAYLLEHSDTCAVVCLPALRPLLSDAVLLTGKPILVSDEGLEALPLRPERVEQGVTSPTPDLPAAILYTSGTTGEPKGCVLSNIYVQEAGRYYAELEGDIAIHEGTERIMNPLPLYHMNSMVTTAGGVMLCGACLVLPGRFSGSHWWSDIIATRTTRFHYLGIMVPALLAQPESPSDRQHGISHAFGAGVDPAAHARFEQRFGIALMEVWGMTETGRFLIVDREPRHIDTRACGRPQPGLQARIVDEDDHELADGLPGELVVRHTEEDPRFGFFSGYSKQPEATELAWRGGWFHSGDICVRSTDGMYVFVDRRKNIIRRSGENIAAAEVEAALAQSPLVAQVAVMAVPDSLRDEEVLACIVPAHDAKAGLALAETLFEQAATRLASFKLPGWVYLVDALPVTGTQKIQKHRVFPDGFAPGLPGLHDLRQRKRAPGKATTPLQA